MSSLPKKAIKGQHQLRGYNGTTDDNFVQEIIASFTGKYGLTKTEVMVEIETAFSAMLSKWYHLEVRVFFREDFRFEAVAYNNSGEDN